MGMRDESEGALESLVNQIAHDVRNHAFTMGLQAEMGLRRAEGTHEVKAHFEAILRQVDALKHYLEQLLLYGRPLQLSLASVDLVALLREQVQRLQVGSEPGAPALPVEVRSEGRLRPGLWDARALAHALTAVLDNAARSATPPPPVTATVQGSDGSAVVEIRDQGCGIPLEVLPKLAVPMAVRRTGGAGLGLAIARKIAEAHGGRLEIASAGVGTTVRLVLPWTAAVEVAPADR
jgi:signal transduction histidine kinase